MMAILLAETLITLGAPLQRWCLVLKGGTGVSWWLCEWLCQQMLSLADMSWWSTP